MEDVIDWTKLAFAIEHYKMGGWQYMEVPWKVPVSVLRLTFPELAEQDKDKFVGSAEQSFLHLAKCFELPYGKFVACSPCSRKETTYNRLHKRTFMKVELFQNIDVSQSGLSAVINDAYRTMSQLMTVDDTLTTVKTDIGWDIELNGIEVGSYGIRRVEDLEWIYGTGLAEPRFSTALAIGRETEYTDNKF